MTLTFAVFLVLHGLIHTIGVAKAFNLAELPQLSQPIAPATGWVWLAATILFFATAVAIFVTPRWWWALGACAILVSLAAVAPSWSDAKFAVLPNLIALAGVTFGFLATGPGSLRAEYERDVDAALAIPVEPGIVRDADLAHLPDPVQRYLRGAGIVGQPQVRNFRVRMHGRIRSGPAARWMPLAAEQFSFVGNPARFFYLNASMFAIPVQGYHRYASSSATMRIKAAALVPVAGGAGATMNQAETVTMFNDMCVFAPATLIDPAIVWEPVDGGTARARFTNGGYTVRAELSFNEAGELRDFRSDDRDQIGPDGRARRVRWSTPLEDYRSFGAVRLASSGEGRWHETDGEYAYIQLAIDDVEYNVRSR
jgi:hypothetical protein